MDVILYPHLVSLYSSFTFIMWAAFVLLILVPIAMYIRNDIYNAPYAFMDYFFYKTFVFVSLLLFFTPSNADVRFFAGHQIIEHISSYDQVTGFEHTEAQVLKSAVLKWSCDSIDLRTLLDGSGIIDEGDISIELFCENHTDR